MVAIPCLKSSDSDSEVLAIGFQCRPPNQTKRCTINSGQIYEGMQGYFMHGLILCRIYYSLPIPKLLVIAMTDICPSLRATGIYISGKSQVAMVSLS